MQKYIHNSKKKILYLIKTIDKLKEKSIILNPEKSGDNDVIDFVEMSMSCVKGKGINKKKNWEISKEEILRDLIGSSLLKGLDCDNDKSQAIKSYIDSMMDEIHNFGKILRGKKN